MSFLYYAGCGWHFADAFVNGGCLLCMCRVMLALCTCCCVLALCRDWFAFESKKCCVANEASSIGLCLGKRFRIPEWYAGGMRVAGSAVQGAVGFFELDDVDWFVADIGLSVSTRSSVLRRGQAFLSCGWVPDTNGPESCAGGMDLGNPATVYAKVA